MVPLVGGPWADVKTVVVGEVQTGESAETIHSTHRSSFSRMEHAQPFPEQASRELLDRGVAQAEHMCAVRDGAEWIDGFVDWPRKDAGRLLDVAHAADSVSSIRHLAHTAGSMVPSDWLTTLLHVCKQEGPPAVLQEVKKLRDQHPEMQDPLKKVASRLSREGRMPSPQSHAAG
jgi:hypothetical protein